MSALACDPPGHACSPDASRREEIVAALALLCYPPSSAEQPGWFLQLSRPGGGPSRPAGTFALFWLYLHPANPFDRPVCDRTGCDLALSCLAMDLQIAGFDACAQGVDYRHGGLVSIIIAPDPGRCGAGAGPCSICPKMG